MAHSRSGSFAIIVLHYLIATVLGVAVYLLCNSLHPYLALFIADAAATIYIWILGLIYCNVSFYDPYWSVAPPVLLSAWAVAQGTFNLPICLMLLAIWYWAIRLTWNWAYTFKGLEHEDWRYTKYRTECSPVIFHIINFFGLNMVPTIVVFLAMLPAIALCAQASPEGAAESAKSILLSLLGFAVCVCAATIQLVADSQSHRFRAANPGRVCNVGLWKHGRHPNYFGEISMWWGIWIIYVAVFGLSVNTWFIAGPLSVTLLFCTVSVPLMEKRQLARKPEYAEYRKSTRLFL